MVSDPQKEILDKDFAKIYAAQPDLYNQLSKKRILFTGSTGMLVEYFICFIEWLNDNIGLEIQCIALGRNEEKLQKMYSQSANKSWLKTVVSDVREVKSDDERLVSDYIIHAASPSSPYEYENIPVDVATINLVGGYRILELARVNKAKIVLISSSSIYGDVGTEYIDEDSYGIVNPMIVSACYCESKRAAEMLCKAYNKQYGVETFVARCRRLYGPTVNLKSKSLLNKLLCASAEGTEVEMFEDPDNRIQLIYLGDAISGICSIMVFGTPGEAYNVASDLAMMVDELARKMELLPDGYGLKVRWLERSSFEADQVRMNKKNRNNGNLVSYKLQLLGGHWKPMFKLEEGLLQTVKAIRIEKEQLK